VTSLNLGKSDNISETVKGRHSYNGRLTGNHVGLHPVK